MYNLKYMSDLEDKINYYTDLINQLLETDPYSEELFWAYVERGLCYYDLVEYDNAIEDFKQAIILDPDEAIPYYNLGVIYKNRSDLKTSLVFFEKAIDLDPTLNHAYVEIAEIKMQNEEYADAIFYFKRAISAGYKKSDVFYKRGICYSKTGNTEKALEDLTTAIKLKPKKTEYYINRAYLYTQTRKYFNAAEDYSKAIELSPNIPEYRFLRGLIYSTVASYIKLKNTFSPDRFLFYSEIKEVINNFTEESCNVYYEKAINDFTKSIELLTKTLKNSMLISPSYYLSRGATFLSWGKQVEAVVDFVMAKKVCEEGIKKMDRIENFMMLTDSPEKYYTVKTLSHMYLGEWSEAKELLNKIFNLENRSERINILFAAYSWKAENDFEKTLFWIKRAVRYGFEIMDVADDIFEGYFLRDFFFLLKSRNINI